MSVLLLVEIDDVPNGFFFFFVVLFFLVESFLCTVVLTPTLLSTEVVLVSRIRKLTLLLELLFFAEVKPAPPPALFRLFDISPNALRLEVLLLFLVFEDDSGVFGNDTLFEFTLICCNASPFLGFKADDDDDFDDPFLVESCFLC